MDSSESIYINFPQQFQSSSSPTVVATYENAGSEIIRLYIYDNGFNIVNLSYYLSNNGGLAIGGDTTEYSTTLNYIAIGLK